MMTHALGAARRLLPVAGLLCSAAALLTGISLGLGSLFPSQQLAYKGGIDMPALHLLDVGRQTTLPLVRDPGTSEPSIAWSPDASRLVFVTNRDGNDEIYVINADGGELRNMSRDPARDSAPVWLDAQHVAFWSMREAGYRRVFRVNVNTNVIEPLSTRMTPNEDSRYAWSPDGNQYATVRWRSPSAEIYVRTFGAPESVRLTENTALDVNPAWSPDGTQLAFWSDRDGGQMRIFVMRADGSGARPVGPAYPPVREEGWSVAWSADGEHIAYAAITDGDTALFRLTLANGEVVRLFTFTNPSYPPAIAWRPG
ncbi:MAG: hypothetical protein SF162_02370 [bacterium]|nr:hypothetical protein [bacterium]